MLRPPRSPMFTLMVKVPLTRDLRLLRARVPVLGDDDLGRVGVVLADERSCAR